MTLYKRRRNFQLIVLFSGIFFLFAIPIVIFLRPSEVRATTFWKLDEGNGSTINDQTTTATNGTRYNAAWQSEDLCVVGKCLFFDGTADYVYRADDSNLDFAAADSFTITLWFRHGPAAAAQVLVSKYLATSGTDGGYKVLMESDGDITCGIDDDQTSFPEAQATSTAATYDDNNWHQVVCVKSTNATLSLYIDGQFITSATTSTIGTLVNTDPFYLGIDGDGVSNGWVGFIDEFRLYRSVRTASDIKADYIAGADVRGSSAVFGQTPDTLSQGLVGYWKMDETAANSCSGGVNDSCDASGNANNGAWNGNAANTTGKFGNGVTHDGAGDWTEVADSASLDTITTTNTYTIALWVKPNQNYGAEASDWYFMAERDGVETYQLQIGYGGWTDSLGFAVGTNTGEYCSIGEADNSYLTSGVWYHIVGVFDDKNKVVNLFRNGEIVASSSCNVTLATGGGAFRIGGQPASRYFNGVFDEVRFYNRALSPAEVAALYAFAPGPVGWWKMDENTGSASTYDSSGNNNTGTLSNSPLWIVGKIGSALNLNGSSSDINVPTSSTIVIPVNSPMTVSSWVNVTAFPTSGALAYIATGGFSSNETYYFRLQEISGSVYLRMGTYRSGDVAASWTVSGWSANTWHYVAGIYTGSVWDLYFDGILVGTTTSTTGPSTATNNQPFSIGSRSVDGSPDDRFLNGSVDDVRLYNYARSPAQIIQDMNGGHPMGGSPVGSQVLYWEFDEGQGTTANNSGTAASSNGALANIASPATASSGWTFTGKVNKGLIFDGSNDYVVITTANDAAVDFATTEPFSASAWVYITTMPGSGNQDAIIAKWDETGNLADYKLYVENDDADTTGNFEVQIYDETASQAITASQSIDQVLLNTWYHVAFTFNGGVAGAAGDLKLYVNGQLSAQNAVNASFLGLEDKAADFTVGDYDVGDAVANNTAFTGTIDEVKIYSGLLTQSEIQVDMNAGTSAAMGGVLGTQNDEGFSLPAMVAWWKMDDNTGSTAVDSSGNSATGTLGPGSGAPLWSKGKFGSGLTFDGSSHYTAVADNANFDIGASEAITASVWVRRTGDAAFSNPMFIMDRSNITSTVGWFFQLAAATPGSCDTSGADADRVCFSVHDGTDQYTMVTSSTITPDSAWHHVVAIFDQTSETNSNIFIDGVVQSVTRTGTFANIDAVDNALAICIGRGVTTSSSNCTSSTSNAFNGTLDDLRIFKSALTATQIAYLYNRGAPSGWWQFDECSGATAYDASILGSGAAGGKNGTITIGSGGSEGTLGDCTTSSTSWFNGATGKYNSSMDFDGTDDFMTIDYTSGSGTYPQFSVGVWVKWGTKEGKQLLINEQNTDTLWFVLDEDGNDKLDIYLGDTTSPGYHHSSQAITRGNWSHLFITYDDDTNELKLYINGILDSTKTTSGIPNFDTTLRIADREDDLNSENFDGQLDDIRLYRYPLTAAQIKTLYNQGSAVRFGPVTGSP